jgi:alkylation response protein AidB-like acyl-CoA dehydrogenase
MKNLYQETQDIQFQIEHCIPWEKVVPLTERGFADAEEYKKSQDARYENAPTNTEEALEFYKVVYESFGEIIAETLLPNSQAIDHEGARLKDGKVSHPQPMVDYINTLRETGLLAYAHQRQYGGYRLGFAARQAIMEMTYSADVAMGIIMGYFNMAEVIEKFGSDQMKADYLPRFAQGKILGAMALTEPNYGSDLSRIKTKAVDNGDGTFSITGTKRFITQGCGFEDAPAAIFTIARSKESSGAKGISFFLVETKDVSVERLEEKIGLHGSATCELVYDNSRGVLIGEEGRGLTKYAIALMNGARLGISNQSLGVGQAALRAARKYASERVQFGDTIDKLPAIRRILEESEARIQASRALIYRTATIVDLYEGNLMKLEEEGLDERQIRKHADIATWDKLAKILTPTSKLTSSEFAQKVASDAVQVHGGVGYTEEFEIAKLYRDARISTIYEGTSQLQAVAIIGGVVEGVSDSSILNGYMGEELAKVTNQDVNNKITEHWNQLKDNVALYKSLGKDEKASAAWDISWHWCYVFTLLLLAQQTEIAQSKNLGDLAEEKTQVLKTYLQIADREIAACTTQIKNMAEEAASA